MIPDSAETTIKTRFPASRCVAAMLAILSQRGRVETLVPPNLMTTQGASTAREALGRFTMVLAGSGGQSDILRCIAAKGNQSNIKNSRHAPSAMPERYIAGWPCSVMMLEPFAGCSFGCLDIENCRHTRPV